MLARDILADYEMAEAAIDHALIHQQEIARGHEQSGVPHDSIFEIEVTFYRVTY